MTERSALRGTLDPTTLEALEQLRRARHQVLLVHPHLTAGETEDLLLRCESPPFWPRSEPVTGEGGVLISSSGTSGQPRIVQLAWSALAHSAQEVWQTLGGAVGDHWLCPLPLAHVAGLAVIERCRVGGGSPVLLKATGDGDELLRSLCREEVQFASLVPTQLRRLLRALGGREAPRLKALLVGGAALPADLLIAAREAGLPVVCSYGLSEAGSTVAVTSVADALDPSAPGDRGELLPSFEGRIIDGELCLRGPALFRGYLGDRHRRQDDWFATGDKAELTGRSLRVTGRLGLSIKRGGEWVDPLEIEEILGECPGLAEIVVFGEADPDLGARLVAVVVPTGDASDLIPTLEQFAREKLARHKRPGRWLLRRQKLPRSPLGKLLRHQVMG